MLHRRNAVKDRCGWQPVGRGLFHCGNTSHGPAYILRYGSVRSWPIGRARHALAVCSDNSVLEREADLFVDTRFASREVHICKQFLPRGHSSPSDRRGSYPHVLVRRTVCPPSANHTENRLPAVAVHLKQALCGRLRHPHDGRPGCSMRRRQTSSPSPRRDAFGHEPLSALLESLR